MKSNEPLYPIREVSRLTGVNAITLRAWERRYTLIEPIRTESGHRVYTQTHIDRIKSAVKLTEQGIPISRVKHLLDERGVTHKAPLCIDDWDYAHELRQRVSDMDLSGLQQDLDGLFSDLSDDQSSQVIRQVTQELVQEPAHYGALWRAVVLPRLYTRLRFLTRKQDAYPEKRFWVQAATPDCQEVLVLLVAIWVAGKGMYPLVQPCHDRMETLPLEALRGLRCEGLAVVDDSGRFDEKTWLEWVQKHPSLEFHYFIDQAGSPELANQLQAHYHDLKKVF